MTNLLTVLPSWVPKVAAVAALSVPLVVAAGYTAQQAVESPAAELVDPLNRTALYEDADDDGLPNVLENYVYGTDPTNPRTASDEVPDGYLARHGYDPADPTAENSWAAYPGPGQTPDAWGGALPPSHRVTVREVYAWQVPEDHDLNRSGPWDNGLDPSVWRSPSGLPVPWLLTHGLDPLDPEVADQVLAPGPEGDGLTVGESYRTATNPRLVDTDGDGLDDDREIQELDTDPSAFSTSGGGVADGWAILHDLDATDPNMPHADLDRDGLTNAEEFNASVRLYGKNATLEGGGLDPTSRTTGQTPIPDGWLVDQGLDPLETGVARKELGCASDHDLDRDVEGLEDVCLTVLDAYLYRRPPSWEESEQGPWMGGLSARTNDTDGDGLPDAVELRGWFVNVTSSSGGDERGERTHVTPDPLSPDTDGDGLSDRQEFLGEVPRTGSTIRFNFTDPTNRDTDFDGLSDGKEILVVSRKLEEQLGTPQALDPTTRDTDGDTLPDGREWFTLRDRAELCRTEEDTYGYTNPTSSVREILVEVVEAGDRSLPEDPDALCELLEPWGDPDGDGSPNVLDRDSDDDGLWDGWEIAPENYAQSPYASQHPRSRTDPVNPDSDGDVLPDAWEVKHGEWNATLQSWNLDPAKWSSLGNDVSDADRDLDDDGISWYTFHRSADGFEREEHRFLATNLVEYRNGTDPNKRSTPDADLVDGWTIFWGRVYPELDTDDVGDVYPGAPGPVLVPPGASKPSPVTGENPILSRENVHRFSTDRSKDSGESLARVFEDVQTAGGGQETIYLFQRTVQESFVFNQEHRTNPYLRDSDGDGAPDAWEVGYASEGYPSPTIHQRNNDEDDDGLPLQREAERGTDPTTGDTDLGGAGDGEEIGASRDPLNPEDDLSVSDPNSDLDCDGLTDVEETEGWTHPTLGEITTNSLRADMDGDGLLDGFDRTIDPQGDDADCVEPLREAGVIEEPTEDGSIRFLGEASAEGDPREWTTAGDGVADGYRVTWELKATESTTHLQEAYRVNRPPWWDEAAMGSWLWAPAPFPGEDVDADGIPDWEDRGGRFHLVDEDLDQDGLSDVDGEDPTPGARPALSPPAGPPTEDGLTPQETRRRAAEFGLSKANRTSLAGHDADEDGIADVHDRLPVGVVDLEIEDATREDGRVQLATSDAHRLTGRVLAVTEPDAPPSVPVPNATVIAQARNHEHPLAAGFTDEDGRFDLNVTFDPEKEVAVPAGRTLFWRTDAPARWTADVGDLPPGPGPSGDPNTLRVWVPNTTGASTPGDPTHLGVEGVMDTGPDDQTQGEASGIEATLSSEIPISLVTRSQIRLGVPGEAPRGATVEISATLTDASGVPLPNETVQIEFLNDTISRITDADGQATTNVTLPDEVGPATVRGRFAGGPHTKPDEASEEVAIKTPTRVHVGSIEPTPAVVGRNLTIAGSLRAGGTAVQDARLSISGIGAERTVSTDGNGTFRLSQRVTPGTLGQRTLEVSFEGTPGLLPATASVPVPVVGGSRTILTVAEEAYSPGETADLRVAVLDPGGEPLPDARVRVDDLPGTGAVNGRTDPSGTLALNLTAPSEPGAWQISAAFPGTEERGASRDEAWLNVSVPTRLELTPEDPVHRGTVTLVEGRLLTRAGEGIGNQPVTLHFADRRIGTVVTGPDGSLETTWKVPADLPIGRTAATARFNGSADGRHQATEATAQTTVKQGLRLFPASLTLRRGINPVGLEVELDNGEPAPPGQLEISIAGLDVSQTSPVRGSSASLQLDVPGTAPLGVRKAHVTYRPDADIPDVQVNTTARVVAPVDLRLDIPRAASRGSSLTVAGGVTTDEGQPVPAGNVSVRLGDVISTVPVQDGRFSADLQVSANASTGPTGLRVDWPRQGPYLRETANATVEIQRPVRLEVELRSSPSSSEPTRGQIVLETPEGEPVRDQAVFLRGPGDVAYLVRTNDEGRAQVLLPPAEGNETTYSFHFAGTETYATASTQTSVQAPASGSASPWTWAAGSSTVLLALVGAAVWYLRRRRRAMAERVIEDLEEGQRRLQAGSEYEAVVLHIYQTFIDLVAERDVEPRDPETLREYQHKIETALGVGGRPLDDLFGLFEDTFYGPRAVGRVRRDEAIRTFQRVLDLLETSLSTTTPPDDEVNP